MNKGWLQAVGISRTRKLKSKHEETILLAELILHEVMCVHKTQITFECLYSVHTLD